MALVIAPSWPGRVASFISGYSFNRMLESFVRRLERQMEACEKKQQGPICYFTEETTLPGRQYELLRCACTVNGETGDFSPAAIYFPGEIIKKQTPGVKALCDEIRQELGW